MGNLPIGVLVVFANPRGTSPLRLGAEDRAIHESIKLSRYRDNILLKTCHASTIHDLRRALLEDEFQIVHISGHGTDIGLVLENELGGQYVVPQQALADLFQAYSPPIRCVILNACFSLSQGQLASLGIPFTIAMEGSISDEAAIEFSRGFYDAIGAGRDIEFAYEEGCRTVRLSAPKTQFVSQILKGRPTVQNEVSPSLTQQHFVTNLEYLHFVQESGHSRPRHWNRSNPHFPDDQRDAPVTGISWNDAVAYCDWVGGCLPTNTTKLSIGNIPEIGEWLDAGDESCKQVYSPHTSTLIEMVNRETPRQNVGFRCVPVRPISPRKWIFMDGASCYLGVDVAQFRHLADSHRLHLTLRQPILKRQIRLYNVHSYQISATCVTNEEYYEFTQAVGWKWPRHWDAKWLSRSCRPFPARLASQPVVNVSVEDAQAYCIWSRTRLPTWIEWEYAATGIARRPYPWGKNYSAAHCNSVDSGRGSLASVDEYPLGDTPEGVRQLCGNVAEWVIGPDGNFELRGGSYLMPCELWGLAYMFRQAEAGFSAPDVGFRIVID